MAWICFFNTFRRIRGHSPAAPCKNYAKRNKNNHYSAKSLYLESHNYLRYNVLVSYRGSSMSFWKKKDNLIISGFVVAFFVGLAVWYDLCCVRAAFLPIGPTGNGYQTPFVDINQKQYTLDDFKGKPVIVNFWATWCPVCVKKMGTLNRFAKKFEEGGGKVLAISQDRGGISTIQAYYARNGYTNLDIFVEASGYLLHAFGVKGLPTAIFINAQGEEVGRLEGGVDWESKDVRSMVDQYFGMKLPQ